MNQFAVVTFVLGLILLNRLFPKASKEEKEILAARFNLAPLWAGWGIPDYEMESVVMRYSDSPDSVAYLRARFDAVEAMAKRFNDALGTFNDDENAVIAILLGLQSQWELYWLNKLLPRDGGTTETVGALCEAMFDEKEWLAVLPHLLNLDYFSPPQ